MYHVHQELNRALEQTSEPPDGYVSGRVERLMACRADAMEKLKAAEAEVEQLRSTGTVVVRTGDPVGDELKAIRDVLEKMLARMSACPANANELLSDLGRYITALEKIANSACGCTPPCQCNMAVEPLRIWKEWATSIAREALHAD